MLKKGKIKRQFVSKKKLQNLNANIRIVEKI